MGLMAGVCAIAIMSSSSAMAQSAAELMQRLEALESRDGGATWTDRSAGLPEGRCSIYRDAMDSDHYAPVGIAFGTNKGDLFFTTEDGDPWERIAADLPSIRTVVAA